MVQFDIGGITSLIVTSVISVLLFIALRNGKKLDGSLSSVKNYVKGDNAALSIINFFLLVAAFIAIWLTVRSAMLYTWNYFLVEKYDYSQFEVLSIVSYALIANLCLSLIGNLKQSGKIKYIISASMQAALIGLIVLLPRYGDSNLLNALNEKLNGVLGFISIALTISIILIILAIAYWFYPSEKEDFKLLPQESKNEKDKT